jgi:DNA-binding CsgD family transcriptional regulator
MHSHLANHDLADAIAVAASAAALAEQAGDARIRASAYTIVGLATMYDDYDAGCEYLERARAVADAAGLDASVGSAYANLSSNSIELFHLDAGERYLAEGLAYSADRDLDRTRLYMVGWLAMSHMYRGRWDDAAIAAAEVLRSANTSTNARWAALVALGRLQARRGEAVDMPMPLEEALQLAMATGEYHINGWLRAARAEAAWTAGDTARCLEETDAAYAHAVAKQHHWVAGELAFWRWRAGASEPPPDWIAAPFALQIAGDWHAAATAWRQLGCPYEAARALADGDATAREEALLMFDALGARPAAAELRRSMRAQGVAHLPRGPRPSTRANRFGLTTRQVEILSLLAEGLSNAEIGDRLSIAPKTAEHHVAAVLAKLDVTSRRAAVKLASSERLIGQT